ncbi:MAG: hypothetical protein IJ514_05805 [Clostridia bacterium]|nr:hypothetical protein [Clostridia bacterium]
MRFNATMTEGVYNNYFTDGKANAGVETGVLVVPYDIFVSMEKTAGEDLTLDLSLVSEDSPVQKVSTTSLWTDHAKTSGLKEAYAVLPANAVPQESHNRLLYFVGYVTDGTNEYYTQARKISMSQVAMNAQENNELAAYHETLKATYMHTHTITYKEAYERTAEIQYGESVLENTAYSADASLNGGLYWDEACTDPVLSTDYVTGDMNVYVKEKNAAEIVSFDYASDVADVYIADDPHTWVSEYEGETGVMKVEYSGTAWTPQFYIDNNLTNNTLVDDLSETSPIITGYSSVYVRMYIKNDSYYTNYWTYVTMRNGVANGNNAYTDYKNSNVVYNQWVDYKFDIKALQEGTESAAKIYGKADDMIDSETNTKIAHPGLYYVADIFVANDLTVNVMGATVAGKSLSFTATDSEGANVDLTNADIAVVAPDGTRTKLTDGTYTPTTRGAYTVTVKTNGYYGTTTFNATTDPTELMSYESEADIAKTTVSGATTTKTWLPSFTGADGVTETGVLFVSHTAGTKWIQQFTFTPAQSITENSTIYDDYQYVVLKMYIVKDDTRQINSSWKYIFMNSSAAKYKTTTTVQYNQWVEYKFDISRLKDYASSSTIKFGGEEDGWVSGNQYWGEFYVAGVYLSND